MLDLAIVMTTIRPPTAPVRQWLHDYPSLLVSVGDEVGPSLYDSRCEFWSLADQRRSPLRLGKLLPVRHYARKNFGYLVAIARGISTLYETDDDNFPGVDWRPRLEETVDALAVQKNGWVNVYRYFTDDHVWPRGLPLDEIKQAIAPTSSAPKRVLALIQQGLADEEPDVDAIWRLVVGDKVNFRASPAVTLLPGAWCPFNSQSTWWRSAAYVLLYLPSHCSMRMTDIWRSLVAQRCLWETGHGVIFHGPEVRQERNPHVLIDDFALEIAGYLKNRSIARLLEDLSLSSSDSAGNLRRCYRALVDIGIFPEAEMALVDAWLADFDWVSELRIQLGRPI